MPSLDIFNNDAFSLQSLTKSINDTPHQPMLLGDMGLFEESGVTTTAISIEKQGSTLTLVPATQRGAPGMPVGNDKPQLVPFNTVHLPERGTVIADTVQNLRAFGSETEEQAVSTMVNKKLAKMRRNIDVTMEWQRIGAVKGIVLDADGTTPLLNMFTAFGVTQQTISFALGNDTTKVKQKVIDATRMVEDELGGLLYTGLLALCGKTFFDLFSGHASVERAYDRWTDGAFLRDSQRSQTNAQPGFPFVGVQFREYRGRVGSQAFIADNEAYLIPMGVPELFVTNFAPADYMETVNTNGLPYYAKQELMRFGKGVELEAQSNPLSICTRPRAVIKLTVA